MKNALHNILHGKLHMHTAFWLAWFVPFVVFAKIESVIGGFASVFYLPYLVISTLGAWRSTRNPPGRLWAAGVYKIALALFLMTILGLISLAAYGFFFI